MKSILYYTLPNESSPFLEWATTLDILSRVIVERIILRVLEDGAKKSIKALKGGIYEIKIHHGGGLRIYFGVLDKNTLLILGGGNKKTQTNDIINAKKYWRLHGQQK